MKQLYKFKANNLAAVKYLIKLGSSLETTRSQGDPAAHAAAINGVSTELLDYLLSFTGSGGGGELYKTDQDAWNILHCACSQGNNQI